MTVCYRLCLLSSLQLQGGVPPVVIHSWSMSLYYDLGVGTSGDPCSLPCPFTTVGLLHWMAPVNYLSLRDGGASLGMTPDYQPVPLRQWGYHFR